VGYYSAKIGIDILMQSVSHFKGHMMTQLMPRVNLTIEINNMMMRMISNLHKAIERRQHKPNRKASQKMIMMENLQPQKKRR
jgi:hypothetical protein